MKTEYEILADHLCNDMFHSFYPAEFAEGYMGTQYFQLLAISSVVKPSKVMAMLRQVERSRS